MGVGGAVTSTDQPSGRGKCWAGSAAGSELVSERRRADAGDELEEVNKVEIIFLLAEATFVSQVEDIGVEVVVGGGLVEDCWISEIGVEDTIGGDRRS